MPKIQLINPGMDSFNGQIGEYKFSNGVSIESMSSADARRFGAAMRCRILDTDQNPSDAQRLIDTRSAMAEPVRTQDTAVPAPFFDAITTGDQSFADTPSPEGIAPKDQADPEDEFGDLLSDIDISDSSEKEVAEPVKSSSYTQESLEKIADEGGITKLREFADHYGVKGLSIKAIIDALMAKQASLKA